VLRNIAFRSTPIETFSRRREPPDLGAVAGAPGWPSGGPRALPESTAHWRNSERNGIGGFRARRHQAVTSGWVWACTCYAAADTPDLVELAAPHSGTAGAAASGWVHRLTTVRPAYHSSPGPSARHRGCSRAPRTEASDLRWFFSNRVAAVWREDFGEGLWSQWQTAAGRYCAR
jgi:hypothetical protein